MISLLKQYKAFLFGYAIIIPIFYLMDYLGWIIIPEKTSYEMVIYALIWGTIIALPIHYRKDLITKKVRLFKIVLLILLFVVVLLIDSNMQMPDNPITFILLLVFWIGWTHVLIPSFIKKYWKLILGIYIPLTLYFTYLRLFSGGLEAYLELKEDFPFALFFLPIPLLFFLWVYDQWKWLQQLKAEKAQAELAMLQAQINPHFFFNTLNNLYALTLKNAKEAPEVILKLSEMMRYTIYEGKKDYVSINEEIEYLSNYIELHKIRYKKVVDIQFEHVIEPSLKVAPLLFIILLENAFKHGVDSLSENAFIHIKLSVENEHILFEISNNFEANNDTSHGIGLENLKRRLQLLYKESYNLQMECKANIYKATLKLPVYA